MKTQEDFVKAIGLEPIRDEMERVNCKHVGEAGHHQCGWCEICDKPRFLCEHIAWQPVEKEQVK